MNSNTLRVKNGSKKLEVNERFYSYEGKNIDPNQYYLMVVILIGQMFDLLLSPYYET